MLSFAVSTGPVMTPATTNEAQYVDFNRMIISMEKEMADYLSFTEHIADRTCTINKVPQHIRDIDRKSYDPIVLSIGPYHHGVQAVQSMEKEKWRTLDFILKLNCSVSLKDYIKVVAKLEIPARNCYSEEVKMSRKQFIQMLLLDSCFILVKVDGTVRNIMPNLKSRSWSTAEGNANATVLYTGIRMQQMENMRTERSQEENVGAGDIFGVEEEVGRTTNSQLNSRRSISMHDHDSYHDYDKKISGDWYSNFVWHDLFLLENQIPFFVISSIYKLVVGQSITKMFEDSIVECVGDILRHFPKSDREANISKRSQHFLHLSHIYLRPSKNIERINHNQTKQNYFYRFLHFFNFTIGDKADESSQELLPVQQQMDCFRAQRLPSIWRRATQYHEAGVRLKKREYAENKQHSLLDITFRNGVVEIPFFPIDENTESLFKNLIAFEQTDSSFGDDITAYVTFMAHLARTCDDVSLLVQKGIIVHLLDSDDEVSALFTRLTKEVTFDSESEYYLKRLCLILEAHYQSRLNRWVAWLWLNHFSNPWLALAALATAIVLVCTVIQTIYTVLAYLQPPT